MKKNNLTNKLKELKGDNDLRDYVIDYVLNDYETNEDIKAFFDDLQTRGCQGGMIHTLIYYADTHKFYDKFYHEIEEWREEREVNMGEPLKIDGDLKNWFAWATFEEIASNIAVEIGVFE